MQWSTLFYNTEHYNIVIESNSSILRLITYSRNGFAFPGHRTSFSSIIWRHPEDLSYQQRFHIILPHIKEFYGEEDKTTGMCLLVPWYSTLPESCWPHRTWHGLWLGDNTFLGWVIFAFDNVIFVLKQRPSQLEDVNLEMKGKSIFPLNRKFQGPTWGIYASGPSALMD